jgi:hypothetical protein
VSNNCPHSVEEERGKREGCNKTSGSAKENCNNGTQKDTIHSNNVMTRLRHRRLGIRTKSDARGNDCNKSIVHVASTQASNQASKKMTINTAAYNTIIP